MKVSIIIPAYNVRPFIEQSIESCINQTISEKEIIIIDDASSDGTEEVIFWYAQKYSDLVKAIFHKVNMKQGCARNEALKLARGEYILFLDSDDYLEPETCEQVYSIAKQHNKDIVAFDGFRVLQDGEMSFQCVNQLDMKAESLWTHFTSPCFMMIRRTFIFNYDIMFPEGIYSEDLGIIPLWYALGNKIKVDKPYYHYRMNMNSTSQKKVYQNQLYKLEALRILIENAKRINKYTCWKSQIDAYIFGHLLYLAGLITENLDDFSKEEKTYFNAHIQFFLEYQFDKSLFYRIYWKSDEEVWKNFVKGKRDIYQFDYELLYFEDKDRKLVRWLKTEETRGYNLVIWGIGKETQNCERIAKHAELGYILGNDWTDVNYESPYIDIELHDYNMIKSKFEHSIFWITEERFRSNLKKKGVNERYIITINNIRHYLEYGYEIEEMYEI